MKPRSTTLRAVTAASLAGLLSFVAAAQSQDAPSVLVFSGTEGPRAEGTNHANEVLAKLAEDTGTFTVSFTEDPADLAIDNLANHDLVLWNNPSGADGAAPFDNAQRAQYMNWTECGGGFVGIHGALGAWNDWPEWTELVGYSADSSEFTAATLTVLEDSPITAAFGAKGAQVAITDILHTSKIGKGPKELSSDTTILLADGTKPVAWTSTFRGTNRAFVTDLGQGSVTWDLPAFQQSIVQGIADVAEVRPDADCVAQAQSAAAIPSAPVGLVTVSVSLAGASSVSPVAYAPDTIVIPAGTSIEFANVDTVTHTITSSGRTTLFDSGFVNLGASAPVTGVEDLRPGTYDFHCQLHPNMLGTITVV